MALEKIASPYELLARWRDGKLSGAHVQFLTVIMEDGKKISETIGDVMPVDVGEGIGFPLADILAQMHVDALAAVDSANTALTEKQIEFEAIQESLDAKAGELSAANAKLNAATAELALLKAEVAVPFASVLESVV